MNKFKEKIALWMFNRLFKYFNYPFDKADDKFDNLTELEQFKYLQDIRDVVENKAYQEEYQEIIRTIYERLATESQSTAQFTGYRLSLIVLKRFDQRLRLLKEKYTHHKKVSKLEQSLN